MTDPRAEAAPARARVPALPAAVLDPRPVVAVGTAAWTVALLVLAAVGAPGRQLVLCAVGIAVGALGYGVFALQRRAVRRGSVDAQRGLDGIDGREPGRG